MVTLLLWIPSIPGIAQEHCDSRAAFGPYCPHVSPSICRPLNYFATLYRGVQKNMMNMDQMLEILEKEPAVKVHLPPSNLAEYCMLHSPAMIWK